MLLPGTNIDGLTIFIGGFGLALAVGKFTGIADEGPLTIIGGVLVTVFGVIIRLANNGNPAQTEPNRPQVLYVAAWQMGLIWMGVGIYEMLKN